MSLGSTRWQVLTKVQLPLARRTIGIGINQTIMMALSMVVITALIGAPGPRRGHPPGAVQAVDVGAAFDAGLAIVILAIVLDRLTDQAGVSGWTRGYAARTRQRVDGAGSTARPSPSSSGVIILGPILARPDGVPGRT